MNKMQCQSCGCEWTVPQSLNLQVDKCPFCGQSLKKREMRFATNVRDAMSEITLQFGVQTLNDGKRLLAFFTDIAPTLQKERRIISCFISCEGHVSLYDVRNSSKSTQQIAFEKVVHKMVDEWYIAETAARMVCQAYFDALSAKPDTQSHHVLKPASDKTSACISYEESEDDYQKGLSFECGEKGSRGSTGVDYFKAVRWYQKAAQAGNIDAMYRMAVIYEMGPKELQSQSQAAAWYEKAAVLGDTSSQIAMLRIGKSEAIIQHWANILDQKGIPLGRNTLRKTGDLDMSVNPTYCEQSARAGNPEAQYQMGLMYEKGMNGLKPDMKKAVAWFETSARAKYSKAQLRLAQCYEFGNGVTKNQDTARAYYKQAANQSNDPETAATAKKCLSYLDAQTYSIVREFHGRNN